MNNANTIINIPYRLRECAFCLLNGKRPWENSWQSKPRHYNDADLQDWISQGNNYGVLGGYGGIWPWDFDNIEARHLLLGCLPETFQVKSRRGSHHYFRSDESRLFTAGVNWKGERAIDITGFGRQVVGPGSIHPESHKPYFVVADLEIAYLDPNEARKILRDVLGWDEKTRPDMNIPRPHSKNDKIGLEQLVTVLAPYWARCKGTHYNFTGAIAGFIAWNRGSQEDAEYVISELAKRTGRGSERGRDVKYVFNSYANNAKHVMGEPTLKRILQDIGDGNE